MTKEFEDDILALQEAARLLPGSDAAAQLTSLIATYQAKAELASKDIAALREKLQQRTPVLPARTLELGLWAAGLGHHPLSPAHRLHELWKDADLQHAATQAGDSVQDFLQELKKPQPGQLAAEGGLLKSVIEAVLAEGMKIFPRELLLQLAHLLEKITLMIRKPVPPGGALRATTDDDGGSPSGSGVPPPPYYWPSTYVSSSSSSGYSSSSWPPGD